MAAPGSMKIRGGRGGGDAPLAEPSARIGRCCCSELARSAADGRTHASSVNAPAARTAASAGAATPAEARAAPLRPRAAPTPTPSRQEAEPGTGGSRAPKEALGGAPAGKEPARQSAGGKLYSTSSASASRGGRSTQQHWKPSVPAQERIEDSVWRRQTRASHQANRRRRALANCSPFLAATSDICGQAIVVGAPPGCHPAAVDRRAVGKPAACAAGGREQSEQGHHGHRLPWESSELARPRERRLGANLNNLRLRGSVKTCGVLGIQQCRASTGINRICTNDTRSQPPPHQINLKSPQECCSRAFQRHRQIPRPSGAAQPAAWAGVLSSVPSCSCGQSGSSR